jgi:hypothetical protein
LTFDVLHGQEATSLGLLDRVQGDDARVVQRGDRARLALEPLDLLRVLELGREKLEGDAAAEARVFRQVHLAHSPDPQRLEKPVRAQGATFQTGRRVLPSHDVNVDDGPTPGDPLRDIT